LGIYSGSFYGTASHAITASYALNAGTGGSGFPFSGSAVITGSLLISSSGLYLSGSGVTGSLLGTASNAISSSYALTASRAISSSRADSSEKVDVLSGGSTTGLGIYSGSFFGTSSWAVSASYAANSGQGVGFPFSGSAVITGSLLISSSGIYLSGSGLTGSVLGTSSWANNSISASHATFAISSSRSISTEKVDVLSGGSTTGLGIYSGSFFGTSSWALNAVNAGAGSGFPFSGNAVITGSLLISSSGIYLSGSGLTGSVLGTSSWANNALTASYAPNAVSASRSISTEKIDVLSGGSTTGLGIYSGSFFGTSSWAVSASYAINSGQGVGFPFSGSAVITGSLLISSSGLYLSGSGLTGSVLGTASRAISASRADSSEKVDVLSGGSTTGLGVYSGSFFGTSSWAVSASYAVNSGTGTVGPGTVNSIALFNSSTAISSSNIFQSSNNIGIGTTNPGAYKLDIAGITRVSGSYLSINDVGYLRGDSVGVLVIQGGSTSTVFNNSSNAATLVTILNGGNVGIGTTSPITKLHVNDGSARNFLVTSDALQQGSTGIAIGSFNDNASAYAPLSIVGSVIFFNNNVGIGTINPTSKLQVVGDAQVSGSSGIFSVADRSTTGTGGFYRSAGINRLWDSTFGDVITWNTSGNVGVGTTNPVTKLTVNGATTITGSSTIIGNLLVGQNSNSSTAARIDLTAGGNGFDSLIDFGYYDTFDASIWNIGRKGSTGAFFISNYGSGPEVNVVTINTSNNVGIGTTSPNTRLQVSSNIQGGSPSAAGTATTSSAYFTNSDTAYGILMGVLNAGHGWIQAQRTDTIATTYNLLLNPNGGSIGVGTTTPGAKFHVFGGDILRTNSDYVNGSAGSGFVITHVASSGNTDAQLYAFRGGNTSYGNIVIPGGSVGIGTTDPATRLHVQGTSTAGSAVEAFRLTNPDTGYTLNSGVKMSFYYGGTAKNLAEISALLPVGGDGNYGDLLFSTRTSDAAGVVEKVRIKFDGKVGIGTTNPANTLQIQGNVSASSYTSSISNAVGYFGTSSWSVSASRGVTTEKVDVLSGGSTTGLGTYSGSFYGTSMIVSGGQAYTVRYDVGNQATTYTVNWNNGNHQSVNLTANTQLSFSNGQPGGAYSLELRPTGTYSASWPSSVKWPSNSEPTQTKSSTKKDIFTFYYDGTVYNGQVFGFDYALS